MENNKNNRWLAIIILSLFFGIIGGVFGGLIARIYIFKDSFSMPFFGQISYDRSFGGASNIIIRDAKKVIVEQDQKVRETAAAASQSLVGIYKKDDFNELDLSSGQNNGKASVINFDQAIGEGAIITSDGWVMSVFKPEEPGPKPAATIKNTEDYGGEIAGNYIIVTKDRKIFTASQIVVDKTSGISFFRLSAADLPVAKFSFGSEIDNGQLLVAANWRGWVKLVIVAGQSESGQGKVRSSDSYSRQLVPDRVLGRDFNNSYLYNLNSEIAALVDGGGNIQSLESFSAIINSFLKFKAIKRPSFGANYLDLSEIIAAESSHRSKGALISKDKSGVAAVKGKPALLAGIKDGDIILSVNNIELDKNNSLGRAISRFLPEDEISLSVEKDKTIKEIKVKLGELK